MTRTPEMDNLLHYMPIIIRSAVLSEFDRKFCASVIGRSKRGHFIPSGKQLSIMRRLVARFQAETMGDLTE